MAYTQKIVLKAVLARLAAISTITNIVGTRIYSDIVENVTFPYVLVEISAMPFQTKDSSDQEHNILVHCFSKKNSPTEAMDCMGGVYTALNRAESNITLDAGNLVYSQIDSINDIFKEPDGITWHGVMNFKMLIN